MCVQELVVFSADPAHSGELPRSHGSVSVPVFPFHCGVCPVQCVHPTGRASGIGLSVVPSLPATQSQGEGSHYVYPGLTHYTVILRITFVCLNYFIERYSVNC